MSLDYLNWCRLCANASESTFPIFEKDGISNFAGKIKYYLHVEIASPQDAHCTPRMCSSCYDRIIGWEQFAEKVQKVQGMFTSLASVEDTNEILEKLTEELHTLKDKTPILMEFPELESTTLPRLDDGSDLLIEMPHKKKKHKKSKRFKKDDKTKEREKDKESDFSDEDDIPLATAVHMDTSPTVLNTQLETNLSGLPKTRLTKIKLKFKTLKEDGEEDGVEVLETEMMQVEEGPMDDDDDFLQDTDMDPIESMDPNVVSRKRLKSLGLGSLFTWECLECQTRVKNWNALVKHCKNMHDSNAVVQCVCGKQLQSRASIMKHRMKHTVGCDFENCNKTFHRQQLLDIHALSHMPKEMQPWMCCKCSRRFHTESLLKQHEKVHLPKEEKLIHPCDVCQKKFCSKSAVTAHVRAVHFGERPFVCDQCGHSFTSKGILQEHLTIHSDVYNFHCKDCNKSFKTKYRLKIHMDTHMETRYQCPVCSLTLNTRRTLRMHLLVHREDKAFQCTTCGKAFKRSKDLKNHYNLHTGRRPYCCPFCLRTFANGSNCRSHKRRMHPEELKMYEAAVAAGQQPVVFRPEDSMLELPPGHSEFADDSTGSNTEASEGHKYSEDEEKPSLVAGDKVCAAIEDVFHQGKVEEQMEADLCDDKSKLLTVSPATTLVPLNLQLSGMKKHKEHEQVVEGDVDLVHHTINTISLTTGENIATNLAQIAFAATPQTLQYPIHNIHNIHNLYTFQSSGIPAFPGNPFFRQ